MSIFDQFVQAYKTQNAQNTSETTTQKEDTSHPKPNSESIKKETLALIDEVKKALGSCSCKTLDNEIDTLANGFDEPLKIAISGQFSSGKSTFLNALLGDDVLPTGITPVTSKVSYITYGATLSLSIHYNNGKKEDGDISALEHFIDQRISSEEIDFVTIYAPLELLKNITFIDTPGLNSQSSLDTETTTDILKSVDGIIWLTLIDNAMKRSEEKALEEFLQTFKEKSLCVLNQKDKLQKKDIEDSLEYVRSKFDHFFSEVVAVSSLQALESRGDEALWHRSNMEQVLAFINNQLTPQATQIKAYAIKKELENILHTKLTGYQTELDFYNNYGAYIDDFYHALEEETRAHIEAHQNESLLGYKVIESIIDTMSEQIANHTKAMDDFRYTTTKKMFQEVIEQEPFEFYKIDQERIIENLLGTNDLLKKSLQPFRENINQTQEQISSLIGECFETFQAGQPAHIGVEENASQSDTNENETEPFEQTCSTFMRACHIAVIVRIKGLQDSTNAFYTTTLLTLEKALFQTLNTLQSQRENNRLSYIKNPRQFPLNKPKCKKSPTTSTPMPTPLSSKIRW